jgi:hypothetical protein
MALSCWYNDRCTGRCYDHRSMVVAMMPVTVVVMAVVMAVVMVTSRRYTFGSKYRRGSRSSSEYGCE